MGNCFGNIWTSYKGFMMLCFCFLLSLLGFPPGKWKGLICVPIDPN